MQKKSVFDPRSLAICSMLTALSIVIGIFCKNFMNFGNGLFRITFENFPIILAGILYGPIAGSLVGAATDILSYIFSNQIYAISPLITIGAASIGLIAGISSMLLKNKSISVRITVSALLAHLIGSVIIKSIGLYSFYGSAVVVRIPLYFLICSLEIALMLLIVKNKGICKTFGIKR